MIAIPAQISNKFQVVIPKEIRQRLKLQPHDTLFFLLDGDTIIIRPKPKSFTKTLRGLHKAVWVDVDVDTWLNEERAAWE